MQSALGRLAADRPERPARVMLVRSSANNTTSAAVTSGQPEDAPPTPRLQASGACARGGPLC